MKFSKEKIDALKAANPTGIYLIEVGGKSCILREPSRQDYSFIIGCKDEMQMNELMVNTLWVDGDEELKTNFKLTIAVAKVAAETIFAIEEAKLKKL